MAGQGAKGGGQVAMPVAGAGPQLGMMPIAPTAQPAAQPAPPALAPTAGFNVNQAAAGALQQAMGTAQSGLGFTPRQIEAVGYTPAQQAVAGQQTGFAYQPSQATAQQLATTDISQYQSPYQQEVIDMTMRDIASAQEKALNLQGAQAQRARAFGGSRQGVAEAETRAQYGQQAADAAARLRQQGFQQAMGAAQFDIGQRAATEAANVAARQAAERFGVGSAATGAGGKHCSRPASSSGQCCGAKRCGAICCSAGGICAIAKLSGAAGCDGYAFGCSRAARRTWPAGIRHRAGDPAAADAARPYAAGIAAGAYRRGAGAICRLHRRTAGSARSAIGGAWGQTPRPVNENAVNAAKLLQLPAKRGAHARITLTHGLPPSSQRRGTQVRDRSRNVPASHSAGEQI